MQLHMRMSVAFALAAAFLAVPQAQARDGSSFQVSPRVGYATLRVDKENTISGERETKDALSVGVAFTAVAPFGVLLEGGYFKDMSNTFFGADDRYELTQYSIAVGYQFESESGVRFTPKAGRTHWRLHSKEGQLFHPGPEAEDEIEAYDYFWEATLQKSVGRSQSKWVGVTFKDNPFDFGTAQSVCFTMTFDF